MKREPTITLKQRECKPSLLQQKSKLHPVMQRVLSARVKHSFDETDYALNKLVKPQQITHLEKAAELLANHIQRGSQILVFGDYDADGATSTALCIRALNLLGHLNVDFLLPDRVMDGYGISDNVAQRLTDLNPDLVITVDTGIASFQGLQKLAQADIDVIVTDHHLPAESLPVASVIVNPNAFADSEGRNLCGVGVAFYLMLATRSRLRDQGWFENRVEPNLADCLDLVAIGTVADLVPLDYNNRILVNEGLKRIRAGQCSLGLQKLIEFSGRNQQRLSSQDIAFAVAPRINAAGRLDDMSIGVQALLANDETPAYDLALALDDINRARRELQGQMTEQAVAMLERVQADTDNFGYVQFQPDWHEGIVGIIASRIKDITFRPSISFASSEQGMLKGSARSIPGVHMRDMLDLVDKKQPGLIERFGGHAMAAGLTISAQNLELFRATFESVLQDNVDASCFNNVIEHDGEILPQEMTLELAQIIQHSGPWGQRFPVPSFIGEFKVVNQRIVADRHLKFELRTTESGVRVEAILFYAAQQELTTNYQNIRIHYELSVNEFRGAVSLQLMIRHIV